MCCNSNVVTCQTGPEGVSDSPESPHLDGLVTVGTVVNDGERLLETRATDADDISDQLTDSNDHLGEKRKP